MNVERLKRLGGIGQGTIILIALLGLLFAANIIIRNLRVRVDLTQDQRYSLSAGTRNLLASLDQPVTLQLFFSSSNPRLPSGLRHYATQVEDLLTEYRIAGRGNIMIQKHDPEPDSDEEEWARRYGIPGQSLEMFGAPVYFGLVASAGGVEAVLPALDPRMHQQLEFNISRMIHQVIHREPPVIGVISSLPVLSSPSSPFARPGMPPEAPSWIAFEELKHDYEVRLIREPENGIDADIDVLVIVHPKGITPQAEFAIDQHVLRGGRALIFVDPVSIADQEVGDHQEASFMMPDLSSTLPSLFEAWGIGFDASAILTDYTVGTTMRDPSGAIEHNPTFLTLGREWLNEDSIATAGLQAIRAAYAGYFEDRTSDQLQVTPLIKTGKDSGRVTLTDLQMGSGGVRSAFQPLPDQRYLALQLSGTFTTAFPDGWSENNDDDPVAVESLEQGNSTVILIADVDMLFDPICVETVNFFGQHIRRPLNDNLAFFANLVDSLAGGSDLINIRSRSTASRPFKRVDALEAQAVNRWREQEAQLEASLQEAQQQINRLQSGKDEDQRLILSENQRAAIEEFRSREVQIRRQLRDVRRNLRRDIERLGFRIKVINIALMPLLVGLVGIVYGLRRRRG